MNNNIDGEYKFVISKPYLDYDSRVSRSEIYGPETPLPAHERAHVRVVYDRRLARHEMADILRELADHIADDDEFDVEWARRAVNDPRFGTGEYHPDYEQRMRDILERWRGHQCINETTTTNSERKEADDGRTKTNH
jgi:hypothetical protein